MVKSIRRRKKRSVARALFMGGVGLMALAVFCFLVFQLLIFDLPKLDSIQDYKPPLVSRVLDRNGFLVAEFFTERRTLIAVETLPSHVKNAFIAAEDANFYHHKGIDYIGLIRAVLNEIKYKLVGGQRMGGSTITQQTAKTMLLSRKQTYTRKIKELVLAQRIEHSLTKEQILNLYLNQIYFGQGAYGIEEAAQIYYGVGAKDLSLGQAASLASVPKSPNRINPIVDPERVRQRRDYVLEQMAIHELATRSEVARAKSEPIRVKQAEPKKYLGHAPYYAEAIRKTLVDEFGEETVYHGGLTIHTAMDIRMQMAGQNALREGLRAVDKRHGWRGATIHLGQEELAILAKHKTQLFNGKSPKQVWNLHPMMQAYPGGLENGLAAIQLATLHPGLIVGAVVKSVAIDGAIIDLGSQTAQLPFSKMSWARPFNPENPTPAPKSPFELVKSGDIILVAVDSVSPHIQLSLEQDPKVDGALAAIDPHSHRVLALVGGYSFNRSNFDRAAQAKRQAGSAFKPFVYGTAIDKQTATPATLITDAPKVFLNTDVQGGQWKPRNYSRKYLGDITVRTCLIRSVNTCSITLLESVGVKSVLDLASKVGLNTEKTPFPHDLTLALGSADITPLSLVNAYTIFPNAGIWSPPILIEKVETRDGEVIIQAQNEPVQAMRPEAAFVMTSMMTGVMERGPGRNVTGVGQPLAGKTGTTNENRSAWFVGFSPNLVAGVYVGFDDNESLGSNEFGVRNALPIWANFMRHSVPYTPAGYFSEPPGVVWRLVDAKTGRPAKSYSAQAAADSESDEDSQEQGGDAASQMDSYAPKGSVLEVFIRGTEPQATSDENSPPPLELFENSLGP